MHQDDWLRAQSTVRWLGESSIRQTHPRVQAAHPGIYYFLDISPSHADRSVEWRRELILNPQPGTVLIWDRVYGLHNSDRQRIVDVDEIIRAGWIPLRSPRLEDGWTNRPSRWRVFMSPEPSGAPATRHSP
jgi:hypothetical protein